MLVPWSVDWGLNTLYQYCVVSVFIWPDVIHLLHDDVDLVGRPFLHIRSKSDSSAPGLNRARKSNEEGIKQTSPENVLCLLSCTQSLLDLTVEGLIVRRYSSGQKWQGSAACLIT